MIKKESINPAWISKAQIVKSLGVTARTFERWEIPATGYVGRTPYYTVADVLKAREGNQKKKAIEKDDLDFQRYRLLKERADAQELKNELEREDVAPLDLIVFVLSKIALQTRSILESLPLNFHRRHPEMTLEQEEDLRGEIAKTMNVIATISDSLDDILDDYFSQIKKKT